MALSTTRALTGAAVVAGPAPSAKRASRVARAIQSDIVALGWPVGTVLGSETELLERYDVSRAVFREAVRLTEHLGIATTRRGPGGGLIVTEPSTAAVVQAVIVYLTYTGMTLEQLIEARISLEGTIATLAAERADETEIEVLRERVLADEQRTVLDATDHHVLHTLIGTAAKNPAAELFVDILGRLTARYSYPVVDARTRSGALELSARAHRSIVAAITAGDPARAQQRMNAHLVGLGDWLGRRRREPKSLDWVLDANDDEKLGSQVARAIIVDIVDQDWPVGDLVGSEAELMARHNVSRSALREAVRLLEHHEVAHMKRGPGGGLVVTGPSARPIIDAATVFLEYRGVRADDLIELRRRLECDAVELAINRATDTDIARLGTIVDSDPGNDFQGPIEDEFHVRVAGLSGNPAITLFVTVLVLLTRRHVVVPPTRSPQRTHVNRETDAAHRAIYQSITTRDTALARRRMQRHLDAMGPLLH